jgi:putative transposase
MSRTKYRSVAKFLKRQKSCWEGLRYAARRSSAIAHLEGRDDELVKVSPLLGLVGSWRESLPKRLPPYEMEARRHHERTGRPLGEEGFVAKLEKGLGRMLHRRKPGAKRSIQN